MLDLKLVRERPDVIRDMLAKRGVSFPLDELLAKDARRRQMLTEVQRLKHQRNLLSLEIAQAKREGRDVSGEDAFGQRAFGENRPTRC
jgi:seryl-tRNA synthetase